MEEGLKGILRPIEQNLACGTQLSILLFQIVRFLFLQPSSFICFCVRDIWLALFIGHTVPIGAELFGHFFAFHVRVLQLHCFALIGTVVVVCGARLRRCVRI